MRVKTQEPEMGEGAAAATVSGTAAAGTPNAVDS